MAKKNFLKGINAVLESTETSHETSHISKKEVIRTTFRLNKDLMENIKALAHWKRISSTELISHILSEFVDSQEKSYFQKAVKNFKSTFKNNDDI